MNTLLNLLSIKTDPNSSVSIMFKNIFPLWIIFLVIIPFIMLYCYTIYKREKVDSKKGVTSSLSLLRILSIILVFLFLWEPAIIVKDFYLRKAKFIFLVDDSKSMSISDKYSQSIKQDIARSSNITRRSGIYDLERIDKMNRLEISSSILTKFVSELNEFKKYYDFSFYSFSEELNLINDVATFSDLKPIGNYTAIGEAIKSVLYEQKGSLLAGIAIVSDGVNNAGENPISVLDKMGTTYINTPIFTLGVGNPDKPKDIMLYNLIAPEEVPLNDIIPFDFTIKQGGFGGKTISCNLEIDDKSVMEKQITLPSDSDSISEKFEYKAEKEGEYKFVVNCPPYQDEINQSNNKASVTIKVRKKLIKILYIEKWPRFEYRALKDAIIRSPESYEAQFFLTEAADGFTQEYTLNTNPLISIPTSRKDLFIYDVILIGDIEPRDIPFQSMDEFMNNIVDFVDKFGGGVGFIAGNNMPSSFKDTPIAKELFPFVVTGEEIMVIPSEDGEDIKIDFELTKKGRTSGIFNITNQNEKLFAYGKDEKNVLSGFYSFVPINRPKNGVDILAEFLDPLERFGKKKLPFIMQWTWGVQHGGRILFIATDELWRWREYVGSTYYGRLWHQFINYLKGGAKRKVSKRFVISTDKTEYNLGEDVKISIKAYDLDFNYLKEDEISLSILDTDNRNIEVKAKRISESGDFYTTFQPEKDGKYTLSIKFNSPDDKQAEDKIGFEVKMSAVEFSTMNMDQQMLKNISLKSNGNFYYIWKINELKKAFSDVPNDSSQVAKITEYELWNSKFFFFLFLLIVSVEWIIRKLVQLL